MHFHSFHTDINMIKSFMKGWENVAHDSIRFERLAGLSNAIWKVTVPDDGLSPNAIIYRKFGDNEDIVDREKEHYIFTELAKKGLGPDYYGGDDKARLEEFHESRSLKPSDANNKVIRRNLAKTLASLHQVNLDELDKTPMFLKMIEKESLSNSVQDKAAKEDLFSNIEKEWLTEILSLTSEDEVSFLKDILPQGKNSVVFSHNDLHSQNILLLDKSQKLVLIDYEYSSYNYRGYDIANFFNEACMDYNVTEYPYYTLDTSKYPGDYDLIDFIRYYLFFLKFSNGLVDEMRALNDEDYFKQVIQDFDDIDNFNAEIEELFDEVKVCAMLSHYYWVLWSVLMSKNPDVNFDYLHYAHKRFQVYQKLKEEYYNEEYSRGIQHIILNE